jgi:uncharacterized membrane protein YeaQ/YmgE (transglycosylase-associated protein family)
MINIIVWLVVGIIAGLLAGRIGHPVIRPAGARAVVCGILGALLGALVYGMISGANLFTDTFSAAGLLAAIVGAVVLLAIVYLLGWIGQTSVGRRILALLALALTALVLVLVLASIVGTWYARQVATETSVQLLTGVAAVAQRGQEAVTRLNTALSDVTALTNNVSQAAARAGQNAADQGVVQGLLPPEKVTRLEDSRVRLDESVKAVTDLVNSGVAFYHALNRMPFVQLPAPRPEQIQSVQSIGSDISQGLQSLASAVSKVAAQVPGTLTAVSDSAAQVSAKLSELQTRLATVSADLAQLQSQALALAANLPGILLAVALVLTLLQAWLAYCLAIAVQHFWATFRAPTLPAPAPAAALASR